MFNPGKDDVRRFFCEAWGKHLGAQPLTPLEAIALDWMLEHPEYHADLADLPAALLAEYPVEGGRSNPFLHLSMHLAVSEQISIDQPPGIRERYQRLLKQHGEAMAAQHEVMDCLAEMIWQVQRHQTAFDSAAYLRCLDGKLGNG